MALLLRRAGTLEALKVLEAPMDVSAFLPLGRCEESFAMNQLGPLLRSGFDGATCWVSKPIGPY